MTRQAAQQVTTANADGRLVDHALTNRRFEGLADGELALFGPRRRHRSRLG